VPKPLAQVGRYAAGLLAIFLITAFFRHETGFAVTTVVLGYLLTVLISSALWGLGILVFMSAAATLVLDYYFFPPVGHFNISDPQDWVTLFAFLITAVIGSELSAHARREAEEANRRRTEIERLYEFSQYLMKARDRLELLNEIPKQIVRIFHAHAAALYTPQNRGIYRAGIDRRAAFHASQTITNDRRPRLRQRSARPASPTKTRHPAHRATQVQPPS